MEGTDMERKNESSQGQEKQPIEINKQVNEKVDLDARGMPKRMADEEARKIINEKINIKEILGYVLLPIAKTLRGDAFIGPDIFDKNPGEAIRALARLILELKGRLSSYDTILSDDASGRLIALVLRKIINNTRDQVGKKPVRTFFVASGVHGTQEAFSEIEKFIASKSDLGKILLVTEFIGFGRGVMPLVEQLVRRGIQFDVAAVSGDINRHGEKYYDDDLKKRLYYGESDNSGLFTFYAKPQHTGVRKNSASTSAHPSVVRGESFIPKYKDDKTPIPVEESVRVAREDVDKIAQVLSKLIE